MSAWVYQSPQSILSTYLNYLPKEHWSLVEIVNGRVRVVLEHFKMSFYGDPAELVGNVNLWKTFPGNHGYFNEKVAEDITYSVQYYKSLKGKVFIFKQDLFKILQDHICTGHPSTGNEVMPIVLFYMEVIQDRLKGIAELVPYQIEEFEEFKKVIKRRLSRLSSTDFKIHVKKMSPEELRSKFKEILPWHKKDPGYDVLIKLYKKLSIDKKKKDILYFNKWINVAAVVIEELEKFIEDHPTWFHLNSEVDEPDYKGKATVRLFEEGNVIHVLAKELLMEMKRANMDVGSIEKEVEKMPDLMTMDFKDLFKKLGKQMGDIEFVVTPIERTEHRAIFMSYIDGTHFTSTTDVILENLQNFIAYKILFQNLSEYELDTILTIFNSMFDDIIQISEGCRFYEVRAKHKGFAELEKKVPEILERKKLEVHKIGIEGFSVEDLKNELERLGHVKTFPEIQENAELVFEKVYEKKREKFLRMCDMYSAIAACQQICILKRNEKMIKFFHDFNACTRIWLDCPFCYSGNMGKSGIPSSKPRKVHEVAPEKLSSKIDNDELVKMIDERLAFHEYQTILARLPQSTSYRNSYLVE